MSETCERRVYSDARGRHICGRPAVDLWDGPSGVSAYRCKFHKGVDERAAKREAAWAERWEAQGRQIDRLRELSARFESLGIEPVSFRETVALHFGLDAAEKILAVLEQAEQ